MGNGDIHKKAGLIEFLIIFKFSMVYIWYSSSLCIFFPLTKIQRYQTQLVGWKPYTFTNLFILNKRTKLYHRRTGPVCPGCQRPGGRGRTPPLGTCRDPPSLSPGESPPSLTTASCANGTSPAESSWPTPRQIPVIVK